MRTWIPLVILVVVIVGGFTVHRIRGFFGSENRPSYSDTNLENSKPFNPKPLTYEIFGPPEQSPTLVISTSIPSRNGSMERCYRGHCISRQTTRR
ncbi:membrane protein [Mycobacterium tuberculosis]|nr:membrane protein [Mycobacterium tuberculosis]